MAWACMPAGAFAAGFVVTDKSVSSLGAGFAGTAAVAEDAGVVYNNPANMLELQGDHLSLGLHRVENTVSFKDKASSISGESDAESSALNYIPNIYYVRELTPETRVGFGLYTPFGLDLQWDDDWIGRYHATGTDIKTITLAPAFAYRVSPSFSVGASLDAQYLSAEMSQAVDFGTLCYAYALSGKIPMAYCTGLAPQQSDGKQVLEGDNWAYSFSLGLAYAPSDATRVGMSFHGATEHEIHGNSDFQNVPLVFAGTFTDSKGHVTLHLPETVDLSVAHNVSPALTLMANYTWTHWSRLDELKVEFDNDVPTSVTEYDWKDVGRYSIGAHYRFNEQWLGRAGFFYDSTPVPDAQHRTPRSPDSDRRGYTLGAKRVLNPANSVDLAVAYLDIAKTNIDNTDAMQHELIGTFETDAWMFSLQWNHQLR